MGLLLNALSFEVEDIVNGLGVVGLPEVVGPNDTGCGVSGIRGRVDRLSPVNHIAHDLDDHLVSRFVHILIAVPRGPVCLSIRVPIDELLREVAVLVPFKLVDVVEIIKQVFRLGYVIISFLFDEFGPHFVLVVGANGFEVGDKRREDITGFVGSSLCPGVAARVPILFLASVDQVEDCIVELITNSIIQER